MKIKLCLTLLGALLLAGFVWLAAAKPLVKPDDVISNLMQIIADYGLLVMAVLFLTIPWRESRWAKVFFIVSLIMLLPAIVYVALIRKGKGVLTLGMTLSICALLGLIGSFGLYMTAGWAVSHYWTELRLQSPAVSSAFLLYCFLVLTNAALWAVGHRIYAGIEPLFSGRAAVNFRDMSLRMAVVNFVLSFVLFVVISAAETIGPYEESVSAALDAVKDATGVITAFYGVLAVWGELHKHRPQTAKNRSLEK
ncbi:hypothetical protein [Paenibacillus sp. HJGM_3]|uniref:hypothetical protein n=1 Tax=Paenibacillus sp. HJGM_3 TaxID=3379816 RepID=UPI00385E79FD